MEKLMLESTKFIVLPNTVRKSFREEAVISPSIVNRYKDNFVILYLGDTGLRRGLMTALDGMSDIIKAIPNVKLVLVGSNKSDDVLKRRSTALGIDEYVDFEGWQDFKLFQSYIMASDICISPLHRNLHHDTTFANKVFQYMAFAKPLVVSDCEAQHIIVEKANCGLVHEAENTSQYVERILTLYHDKSLQKSMGENGQVFVDQRYNWEKKSEDLVNYYKGIAEDVI
jgi:glycosyltransferase involved in cell wall biosynthesis